MSSYVCHRVSCDTLIDEESRQIGKKSRVVQPIVPMLAFLRNVQSIVNLSMK